MFDNVITKITKPKSVDWKAPNKMVLELNNSDDKLKEEKFDFYTPKKEGNFIDYINKYDDYKVKSDENNIGNEGN